MRGNKRVYGDDTEEGGEHLCSRREFRSMSAPLIERNYCPLLFSAGICMLDLHCIA